MLKKDVVDVVLSLRTRRFMPAKAVLIFGVAAWVLSGCAASFSPWAQVGGSYKGTLVLRPVDPSNLGVNAAGFENRLEYQVILSAGWRREIFVHDALLLTRDGVSLQYIRIGVVAVGDELPLTKKAFANGMSPPDVATLELDEVRSNPTLRNFAVVENTPFQVAGFPGFKLVYTFKTENGLRLKRVHYGVLVRNWVYRVQYQAAARYYFDKDLATFEQVRESFRIAEKP